MVREHLGELSDHRSPGHHPDDTPSMFQRASDVRDPLPPVRQSEQVVTLHREWIRITSAPVGQSAALRHRLVRLARRILNRGTGGIDREMIGDLIRAIDTVAARCDIIADHLAHQDVVVDDAVTIFGEELTRIRAELAPRAVAGESPLPSATALHE
jgi:hypothetical protein